MLARANPKIGPIKPYSTVAAQAAAAPELKSVTIPLLNVAWKMSSRLDIEMPADEIDRNGCLEGQGQHCRRRDRMHTHERSNKNDQK